MAICIMPVIKLLVLTISYKIAAVIIEPIAQSNITSLIDQMGDVFKIFLAVIIVLRNHANYRNNVST